jgi:ATP-dependent Clp protease ATP-binding subunit ClpA
VVAAIADHARLPAELVEGDDAARAARFEQLLSARIAGQPRAVAAVAGALVRTIEARRAATTPARKPLASLLLLGPTGTGKTETARLFAEGWFLDPRALFAVDLSEYQDKESLHRLIGAPPGYLGHGDRTPLAIAMAERPRRVVLFDEIEKAHRDVLDVLLQVLDEGRLTTGQGEAVRFDEAVVILTSNLAIGGKPAARAGFAAGDAPVAMEESDLRAAVAKELRPELIGRLDALVRFEAIDRTPAQAIALAHLRRLGDALITTGRLAPARLPALRKDVLARLGARDARPLAGGAREVMRLVEDVVRDERASAPTPHTIHVVYPWHDGGREVAAAGMVADLAPGADPVAAADLVLVHPAGASLLYVAQIGSRLVALLGDDGAASEIAGALEAAKLARRTEVAHGRVRGDVAGRPIGELVDKLLRAG